VIHCRQCRRQFEFSSFERTATCPHCGHANQPPQGSVPWVSVAKLSNLAEVGYFDSVLSENGIQSVTQQHEDYDAVAGTWGQTFILRVAEADAPRAASLIEVELEREQQSAIPRAGAAADDATAKRHATSWKPLAAAVVVVLIAYYLSRFAPAWMDRPAAADRSLWRAVAESGRPLATTSAPGEPRMVLYYDRDMEFVVLEEDHDGDGQADRRRAFAADRMVSDLRLRRRAP